MVCAGALAAMLTSTFTQNLFVQIAVFALVSIIALIVTRPLKARLQKRHEDTNAQRNIGRVATVILAAQGGHSARAQLDGVDWNVRCDSALAVGDACRITAIDGTTLVVDACELATQ